MTLKIAYNHFVGQEFLFLLYNCCVRNKATYFLIILKELQVVHKTTELYTELYQQPMLLTNPRDILNPFPTVIKLRPQQVIIAVSTSTSDEYQRTIQIYKVISGTGGM